MASLKELVRSAQAGENLVVTAPHADWMEMLEHEQRPNAKALRYVVRALLGDFKHERSGRFSPSSMGECPRRILFEYAGAPRLAKDIDSQEMADHGTAAHLKWQIEGLTMGYMTEAEVWVDDPELMVGGSIDAELVDSSIFELKTVHPFVYNKIVLDQRAPKWEHLLQVNTYLMLSGADWCSVVYEDRGSGQFHEFRISREPKIEKEVIRRLQGYKRHALDDTLPPQLPDCELRVGATYRRCPFRMMCPKPRSLHEASELASGAHGQYVPVGEALPAWAAELLEHMAALEAAQR
jgi:hypothetical protein